MIKVVIVVSGGVVQDVYASEKVEVDIVDYDNLRDELTAQEADAYGEKAVNGLEHVH